MVYPSKVSWMKLAGVVTILMLACSPVVEPEVGGEFTLRVGETARFRTIDASVTFLSVIADSRCPASVRCFWEGDGALEIGVRTGQQKSVDTVHTNLQPTNTYAGSVQISVVDLAPYPDTVGVIDPDSYSVTFSSRSIRD